MRVLSSNEKGVNGPAHADLRRTDSDLVGRCRRGDPGAFEELYRQHSSRLYGLAYRMSGSIADAEDLLQEIFLLAYRKLSTFKGDSALATWLYRLAMNHCLDHLRSRTSHMAAATESLDARPDGDRPMSRYTPGEVAPARIDLERAIARLPAGCRAAFVLHDVEGLEHREVGNILGIAEGTSKSQVHKARLRIRAYLTGERLPAVVDADA